LRLAFLAEMGEQKKDAGQPLFAGIEKLIHQIFFVTPMLSLRTLCWAGSARENATDRLENAKDVVSYRRLC